MWKNDAQPTAHNIRARLYAAREALDSAAALAARNPKFASVLAAPIKHGRAWTNEAVGRVAKPK